MTTAGDRGWGDPDAPNFRRDNIVTIDVEGVRLAVHRLAAPIFRGFLTELVHQLGVDLDDVADDWGYANRCVRGTGPGTGRPCVKSEHAWGTAIDVNATSNPMTSDRRVHTSLPPAVSQLAGRWGLRWGGDYTGARKDPMHFEFMGTPASMRQYPKGAPVRPIASVANTVPRIHIAHHTLEGDPVATIDVPVRLDDNGNGESGPDEGVHIDMAKYLTVDNVSVNSPNYGQHGEDYITVTCGRYEKEGKVVIQADSDDPRLAGITIWPRVLVAD